MYFLKNGKVSRYGPSTQGPKDFNKIAVNDIEFIDKYEIWYATFGQGLFLQDMGTVQNFDQNDGLKSIIQNKAGIEELNLMEIVL